MSDTVKEIGSTIAKLRALLSDVKKDLIHIQNLQDVLTSILDVLWDDTKAVTSSESVWKETLSLVASGRVLSIAAQAEHALDVGVNTTRAKAWISNGSEYCRWLGRGVVKLALQAIDDEKPIVRLRQAAQVCGKSLTLGHNDIIVELLLDELIINEKLPLGNFQDMLICLTKYEQRQFLLSTIRIMDSKSIAPDNDSSAGSSSPERIAASITLLTTMLIEATSMAGDLIHHISSLPCNLDLVRIVVGALQIPYVEQLLQKVWEQFGDKLHIKHDSIMQQESTARTLLLCAAKLHRAEPMSVFMHARSSLHANTMSNRLGSSSARIRLLGIFVGQAISQLTDKTDESQMNFELEGAEADEAGEWAELIYTEDKPGPLTILSHISSKAIEPVPTTKTRKVKPIKSTQSTKPRIIEVLSGSEDDDLKPYAKPDSDPEDSDEDATLVQRNKPKAPVYIRDLLSGLLDSANPLVHTLALDSAAPLISRKSSFGTELLDQLPALAACLAGLQDHFDTEDFDELRQAAMVSTIVAQPRTMGPWYAKECFIGDYSIGQRAGMLIAIGLAARELGGFERVKHNSKRSQPKLREAFPSKVLPSKRLHMLYGGQVDTHGQQARPIVQSLQTAEVDTLTRLMSQSMLTPISTRKSASVAAKSRTRVIRNDLASIVAECFFFPLTGYWAASTRSRSSPLREPSLLALYLKTLALLLHSSGASVLVLPQLTSEFWSLLLAQRTLALSDSGVLEAVLMGFLAILSVTQNDQRRVALENAAALVETREWIGVVWEKLEDGGSMNGRSGMRGTSGGEENNDQERCKMLAAGVLVQIKEVVEQYQRLMAGDLLRM